MCVRIGVKEVNAGNRGSRFVVWKTGSRNRGEYTVTSAEGETSALRDALSHHQLWLCETLLCHHPSSDFPVSQTYIDTCLVGCLEHGGISEATAFIEHTHGWNHPRINDRVNPVYPRAAAISKQHLTQIDTLLKKVTQSTQRHSHSCCY